jgi:hypothetical protein
MTDRVSRHNAPRKWTMAIACCAGSFGSLMVAKLAPAIHSTAMAARALANLLPGLALDPIVTGMLAFRPPVHAGKNAFPRYSREIPANTDLPCQI